MEGQHCDNEVDAGGRVPATGTGIAVLDKIAALEASRKQEREKRREEVRELADPRESVRTFLTLFGETIEDIKEQLAQLESLGPQQEAEGRAAVQAGLDAAAAATLALEGRCASAAYFLPTFEQKQCAATIAEVRERAAAATAMLLPKRRFAFSGKVNRVKAAAAAGQPGGTVAGQAGIAVTASGGSTPHVVPHSGLTDVTGAGGTAGTADVAVAGGGTSLSGGGVAAAEDVRTGGKVDDDGIAAVASERDVSLARSGRGLMALRDQTVVVTAEELAGHDYVLVDLRGCTVYLVGHLAALRVLGLRDCRVYCGPVTGACFVDDVRGSTLMLAAYQVRIHRTHATDLYLRVRSNPIIEHSSGVRFAPYAFSGAPGGTLEGLLASLKLGQDTGMYRQVDDFGWIKATQSPNWSVLPPEERLATVVAPPTAGTSPEPPPVCETKTKLVEPVVARVEAAVP